jgi:uncharacterized membrane protein
MTATQSFRWDERKSSIQFNKPIHNTVMYELLSSSGETVLLVRKRGMNTKRCFKKQAAGTAPVLLLIALLLAGSYLCDAAAQGEEPTPIEIELIVPEQAGPGTIIDVSINYDIVDPNAGANINYNVSGPGHVYSRDPEPPDPSLNIWTPNPDHAKGTIKIQVQIDDETDGQLVYHVVEIRWGNKVRTVDALTDVKTVSPTPTPISTPVPTSTPRPRSRPTVAPQVPVEPALRLIGVVFLDPDTESQPKAAEANQDIGLQVDYTSSGDVEDVTVVVRFKPDVVNLDGMQRVKDEYVRTLPLLSAAPDGAALFDPPLTGHIRPYDGGGELYELRAFVRFSVPEGTTENVQEIASVPLPIRQHSLIVVKASTDTDVVRVGGSIIVHVICENQGQASAQNVVLQIVGLPEGFSVYPDEQVIDQVAGNRGSTERLFTIHAPDNLQEEQMITFKAVATVNEKVIESKPMTVQLVPSLSLNLAVSVDQRTVHAGAKIEVNVAYENEGRFPVQNVTAQLIDTTGNLDVLLQEIGDIAPGGSTERTFSVQVPQDFPADAVISLIVRARSGDGTTTESPPIPVKVACVPVFDLSVQPPSERLLSGQSVEVVVTLSNVSQCMARDVLLSIEGLPEQFPVPPEQRLAELEPGATRHLTFHFLTPKEYQGTASFAVRVVSDSVGVTMKTPPSSFAVSGIPIGFTILFGFLVILAIVAIAVGFVLYLRYK